MFKVRDEEQVTSRLIVAWILRLHPPRVGSVCTSMVATAQPQISAVTDICCRRNRSSDILVESTCGGSDCGGVTVEGVIM